MSGVIYNLPSSSDVVPLIVFVGESNTGGRGANADLTTFQLGSRPSVQILNNFSLQFESLRIGQNNLIDHAGLDAYSATEHGWENGLATSVEAGLWGYSQVYLVKAGQGGSVISQWTTNGTYFSKFATRINTAITLIKASNKTPLIFVWYSQGINDRIAGTTSSVWKSSTLTFFGNIRQYLGYVPILEPTFMSGQGLYNTYLSELAVSDKFFFTVDSTGATVQGDGNHWTAAGQALIASRLADKCINSIGKKIEPYIFSTNLALAGIVRLSDVAPTISTQPLSQTVAQGTSITFSVTTAGVPIPSYQWQRQANGSGLFVDIPNATSSTYTFSNPSIATNNGDVYKCIVANIVGSVTSASATLTVVSSFLAVSPVNWIGLVNSTNASPSEGYISSATNNSGGRSDRSINATQPFAFIFDMEDSATTSTNVVYLDDDTGTNYAWDGSNQFVSGAYDNSAYIIYRATGGNTNTLLIGTTSLYPYKIKGEKSGNDVIYSISTNGGNSWTVLSTHAGVLSGKTTLYLKALFAVAGAKKIKVYQS